MRKQKQSVPQWVWCVFSVGIMLVMSACQSAPEPQVKTDARGVRSAPTSSSQGSQPSSSELMAAMSRELNDEVRRPSSTASLEADVPQLSTAPVVVLPPPPVRNQSASQWAEATPLTKGTTIVFGGPLLVDHDSPGWLEVHPDKDCAVKSFARE